MTAKPRPPSPKEQLLQALRDVERPAPVLDVLSPSLVNVLGTRLSSLSPEQREQLMAGELATSMPLLHLKAGGSAGPVLFELATTPAAARELPAAFELLGQVSDQDRQRLVRLAHDLAQRAALHFLRDRVLDVAQAPESELPPLLAALERAATAAERPHIARLALEAWAAQEPVPPPVWARLGTACASEGDERCLQRSLAALATDDPAHAELERLQGALATASSAEPIARAWSLLRLARYTEAQRALQPVEARARQDLRIAAAGAVALAEGSACPGLPPGVGTPKLCAEAVKSLPGFQAALANMEAAFQSGQGRDPGALEAYIGLAHVVPWVTELSIATDAASLERDFSRRHQALSRVLSQLPEQKSFSVFCDALAAGVSAGLHAPHGQRPQLQPEVRRALWTAAQGVSGAAPRLAVAAVLAADQSVLEVVPASVPDGLLAARAGLLAWEASSGANAGAVEAAKAALVAQLAAAPKGSLSRASAVLLLAELEAASAPSERNFDALAKVSSQLIGEALPPELALRAVLDAAGSLERLGRKADALGVLSKAAEIESLPGPGAELLALIRAEKLVLQWDAKRDPARRQLGKQLAALHPEMAPPTVGFVLAAWSNDAKQLPRGKPVGLALAEQIGVRAAEAMGRATLIGTRVSLRVSYSFQGGLAPEVEFDPMLIPLVRPELVQRAAK